MTSRGLAKGGSCLVELSQYLFGGLPSRAASRGDHGVALVRVHEAGGLQQPRQVVGGDGQEAVLVGVDQLARFDALAEDFDRATPAHGRDVRMADAKTPRKGLEAGVVHLIQISNR